MHALRRLTGLALAAVVLVACAPPVHPPAPLRMLGIGDSVMLGGKSALQADIPGTAVDAVVSRQYASLPLVVAWHAIHASLPATVVVHLGTNGTISGTTCDAVAHQLGQRRIIMVTLTVPRTWQDPNNATIRACAARNHAIVADWHAISAGRADWLAPDGYHLRPAGAAQYAKLIGKLIG